MAAVEITYKGANIAELDGPDTTTLKTGGTYCEGDIEVAYTPHSRTYELTLAKASGLVLLTALDEDVLAHISDETMTVSLITPYTYEWYAGNAFFVTNKILGIRDGGYFYGWSNRNQSESKTDPAGVYAPANNTDETLAGKGLGAFVLVGSKYYIKPSDGFLQGGTYRLTFQW